MRENLHRGKRVDNGEWVEGQLLRNSCKSFIIFSFELTCDSENETDFYATEWYEVIPETVGRYTGKSDKSEVKIFGGDKFWDNDYEQDFTVEWDEEMLAWMAVNDSCGSEFLSDIWNENCVIIGNVQDTGLLKGGDAE